MLAFFTDYYLGGYVTGWQLCLVPVLIGLIIFYIWYKKKQV